MFAKKYADKKMILILDNAPYHHMQGIPSLTSMTKDKLVSLMEKVIPTDAQIMLPCDEDLNKQRFTYSLTEERH